MGFDPAWSPDGTQLVFATATAPVPSERNGAVSELWIADIATGKTVRLRVEESLDPSWSPTAASSRSGPSVP
jgi:Tol biopolymer transport system component